MENRIDNYRVQAERAKKRFLTYHQPALIEKCRLRYDAEYLYPVMLGDLYRLNRFTGDLQRQQGAQWVSGDSFAEIMVLLDWLCDSRVDRFVTGNWINLVSQGSYFHRDLQEGADSDAILFDDHPVLFCAACESLGGQRHGSADISYVFTLVDDLQILLQLWRGDEEFTPRLRYLWDANTVRYIRYETTWYALGLLVNRIKEKMKR